MTVRGKLYPTLTAKTVGPWGHRGAGWARVIVQSFTPDAQITV
jgi:hypothetical protein